MQRIHYNAYGLLMVNYWYLKFYLADCHLLNTSYTARASLQFGTGEKTIHTLDKHVLNELIS